CEGDEHPLAEPGLLHQPGVLVYEPGPTDARRSANVEQRGMPPVGDPAPGLPEQIELAVPADERHLAVHEQRRRAREPLRHRLSDEAARHRTRRWLVPDGNVE